MKDVRIEILEKIKEYDSIVIGRHFRPDGDAVGSTMGLGRIISLTFPEKKVYLSNNDKSDYMAFLGDISQSVDEEIIKESLVIVIDTATRDRVSDERILEGREVIKIDHHIPVGHRGSPYARAGFPQRRHPHHPHRCAPRRRGQDPSGGLPCQGRSEGVCPLY